MLYSLTDKLSFEENPKLEIKGTVLEVKSDARTVLKLMDVVNREGEVEGALKAVDLLFSEKDRKALDKLNLSMQDYTTVIATAMELAVGEDPDASEKETQSHTTT